MSYRLGTGYLPSFSRFILAGCAATIMWMRYLRANFLNCLMAKPVYSVRFMSGAGYIMSNRLRLELNYLLELSRNSSKDALTHSDNSFRLDFRFSFKEGLLHRQEGPE